MLTITLPTELAESLTEEASRRGVTSEVLALEDIRSVLPEKLPIPVPAGSLLEYLAGYVGTVAGSSEPFSQNCGQKFAEGLPQGKRHGHDTDRLRTSGGPQ